LLDLYEVLDISEAGMALQCSLPIRIDQTIQLNLDFAEAPAPISASARVAWLDSGKVGLSLTAITPSSARQLKQWLFLNALSAAENSDVLISSDDVRKPILPQNYTDILAAASAVQREAEALGPDLEAVLNLLTSRSRSLLRASGAAIALEGADPGSMICRASSGLIAPPVGLALEVGSGFSGECVRTGMILRCEDTETDPMVDLQTCRVLGIRSMVAAPVRVGEKVMGLLEVFSPRPNAFGEADSAVLQRFSETILAALNRAVSAYLPAAHLATDPVAPAKRNFTPPQGGVLSAKIPEKKPSGTSGPKPPGQDAETDGDNVGGVRLPKSHLYLLFAVAATIFLALGYLSEPFLQPWVHQKLQAGGNSLERTVLASSSPAEAPKAAAPDLHSTPGNFAQLQTLANTGDPAAENSLGLLYIAGDEKQGISPDESTAVQWFLKAAEHGSVAAQSKLGSLYWGGRGVAKDDNRAYFWTVLARANGDDASKVLAPFIAMRLTPPQRAAIEQQAEQWLQHRDTAEISAH
jgi:putative methionine-R-sulfoxide reductase with GAF domain